jgi:hypothetical protein
MDGPLRKAEIQKRTQDHARQVKEKEALEKGLKLLTIDNLNDMLIIFFF